MLPVDQPLAPGEKGFIHEIKWDGYRLLAQVDKGKVALVSRNGRNLNSRFPQLVEWLQQKGLEAVMDGEVVALTGEGRVDFSLLQQSHLKKSGVQICYIVFDLLYLLGESICAQPWFERRERLEALLPSEGFVLISPLLAGEAPEALNFAREHQLEGIISKDRRSPYLPGKRSPLWRKQRITRSTNCVLAGVKMDRTKVRSMAVALYNPSGELVYIGNVGSGLKSTELDFLEQSIALLATANCPVTNPPAGTTDEWIWFRPLVVVEVEYLELTSQTRLRHPVFLRFRFDKSPQDCTMEEKR